MCKCTASERSAGMGCRVCNPEYVIDMMLYGMAEQKILVNTIKELINSEDVNHFGQLVIGTENTARLLTTLNMVA